MQTDAELRVESEESGPGPTIRLLRTLNSRLSTLFGMPDYARYLAHQHAHHPECRVMSEKEFVQAELERKYAGGGARCC